MVDQHVAARHLDMEVRHDRAIGRDQGGLHVFLEMRATLVPDLVEDLADDMEARDQVRATVADEQAHGLAGIRLQRLVADQGTFRTVEQDIGRVLVDRLLHVERLQALLAILADRVEIALHDVVLVIDLRQSFRRLDQDQSIHAVGDVHADRRRRAVVDEQAVIEGLEGEPGFMARCGEARCRATARAGHAVQVDVVRHLRIGMVLQVELDRVALANADEAARDRATKGPERVARAFRDFHFEFTHLELDDDLGRRGATGGRRNQWRTGQDRVHRFALWRTEVTLFRTSGVGLRAGRLRRRGRRLGNARGTAHDQQGRQ